MDATSSNADSAVATTPLHHDPFLILARLRLPIYRYSKDELPTLGRTTPAIPSNYKRAAQLLKAEEKKGPLPEGAVATGLPNQPAEETALAFAAAAAATAVDAALETEDFAAAMTALAALRGPVDAFFTGVMVNSDVAEERENRLKLLGQVRGVMGRVADFGQIAG